MPATRTPKIPDYLNRPPFDEAPLNIKCRLHAAELQHRYDIEIAELEQELAKEERSVRTFSYLGAIIVIFVGAIGVTIGAIRIIETLDIVEQASIMLMIDLILALIGDTVVMTLLGLAVAEIINAIVGDPYHRSRERLRDLKLIMRHKERQREEDAALAKDFLGYAITLEQQDLERHRQRSTHSQRTTHSQQSTSNHTDGAFSVIKGGKSA